MADGHIEITNNAPKGMYRLATCDQTSTASPGNDWWHGGDFDSVGAALSGLRRLKPDSFVTCIYDDAGVPLFERHGHGDITDRQVAQFTPQRVLEATAAKQDFMLTGVYFNPDTYTVWLPKEPILATDKKGRRALERGQTLDPDLWRWAAGGGLMILDCLDCSAALVLYRGEGAPSYPKTYTAGTGLSSSPADMVNPTMLAIRELCEETPVEGPNGLFVPEFGDPELDQVSFSAIGSARSIVSDFQLDGTRRSIEAVPATFMELPGERDITIRAQFSSLEVVQRGLVLLDPQTRGIDFLKVVRLAVPYRLDELRVYCGEVANGKSLNSTIGALRVEGNRVVPEFVKAWQGGNVVTASFDKPATPVLQVLLDALK